MTLTGPQKIPFASTKYWYGAKYPGSAMEVNVGVVHTTEGTSLPSYEGGATAPNVTGLPDIKGKKIGWYQHFDVDRSSRALMNKSGGVETNTANSFQVELVGTCDPAHKSTWGKLKAGVDYIYWPTAPDWALQEVAKLVKWLADNHNLKAQCTVTFKAYPASYGANGVRLTGAQWNNYYGWLGHQHVPENDHGDPGNIDIAKIMAYAKGTTPAPPKEDEDVALSAADIQKVAQAVWDLDVITAAAPPYANTDYDTNKTWTAKYAQADAVLKARQARAEVADLQAQMATLNAKLESITNLGPVNLDVLATKVADLLAQRLAS